MTKALGQEIDRVFTTRHDIYLQTLLFYHLYDPGDLAHGPGGSGGETLGRDRMVPDSIAWSDAGEAIRCAVELPLERLPSRAETYMVFTDIPHGKFSNAKARRQLGWQPRYHLEQLWNKSKPGQ